MKRKLPNAVLVAGMMTVVVVGAMGCGNDGVANTPNAAAAKTISTDSLGDNDVVLEVQGMV